MCKLRFGTDVSDRKNVKNSLGAPMVPGTLNSQPNIAIGKSKFFRTVIRTFTFFSDTPKKIFIFFGHIIFGHQKSEKIIIFFGQIFPDTGPKKK